MRWIHRFVGAIAIVIVTTTIGAAADTPPFFCASIDESAYRIKVQTINYMLEKSVAHFNALLADPDYTAIPWELQVENELTVWTLPELDFQFVDIPPTMADTHEQLMHGLHLYAVAADAYAHGLNDVDMAEVSRGATTLAEAHQQVAAVAQSLVAADTESGSGG